MKYLLIFLFTATLVGFAQQGTPNVQATAVGICNTNAISNQAPVTITCNTAMDKATSAKMVSLLNQILRGQNTSDEEVSKKLDLIMDFLQSHMNPNRPVTTYNCGGTPSTVTRSVNAGMSVTMSVGGNPTENAFQRMIQLRDGNNAAELLSLSLEQMKSAPDWITPYLFAGLAHRAMGQTEDAKKALHYYDEQVGPAYDGDPQCKQMADFLRAHL